METTRLEKILIDKVRDNFRHFGVKLTKGVNTHPQAEVSSMPETYLITGTISELSWPFESYPFFRLKKASYPPSFQPEKKTYGNFTCSPEEVQELWHVNEAGRPLEPIFRRNIS